MRSLIHFLRYGQFDHDVHRGRDTNGRAVDVCALCGFSRLVLADKIVIGPAHHQQPDIGANTTKAKRVRSARIHDIRESQR
jgi:hypothetical protein